MEPEGSLPQSQMHYMFVPFNILRLQQKMFTMLLLRREKYWHRCWICFVCAGRYLWETSSSV